jgi:hypothetical protein
MWASSRWSFIYTYKKEIGYSLKRKNLERLCWRNEIKELGIHHPYSSIYSFLSLLLFPSKWSSTMGNYYPNKSKIVIEHTMRSKYLLIEEVRAHLLQVLSVAGTLHYLFSFHENEIKYWSPQNMLFECFLII